MTESENVSFSTNSLSNSDLEKYKSPAQLIVTQAQQKFVAINGENGIKSFLVKSKEMIQEEEDKKKQEELNSNNDLVKYALVPGTMDFCLNATLEISPLEPEVANVSAKRIKREVIFQNINMNNAIEVNISKYYSNGNYLFSNSENPNFLELFYNGTDDIAAKMFLVCVGDKFVVKHDNFYKYSEETKLWECFNLEEGKNLLLSSECGFFDLINDQLHKMYKIKEKMESSLKSTEKLILECKYYKPTNNEDRTKCETIYKNAIDKQNEEKELVKEICYNMNSFFNFSNNLNKTDFRFKIVKEVYTTLFKRQGRTRYPIDNVPYILPLKNKKVIDYKNLKIRSRTKEDYCTYEPTFEYHEVITPELRALMVKVLFFIASMFCENKTSSKVIADYLTTLIGSAFLGTKPEGKIGVIYGLGSNGKSTFMKMVELSFPEICKEIPKSAFVYSGPHEPDSSSPNPALHMVKENLRLIYTSEISPEDKLNENVIKCLTGQEGMRSRNLYENGETIYPNCMLFFNTNNAPKTTSTPAIVRRFCFFETKAQFVDEPNPAFKNHVQKDSSLIEKMKTFEMLEAAYNVFLRCGIGYVLTIQQLGYLSIPPGIINDTKEIISSTDGLQTFIDSEILTYKPTDPTKIIAGEEYADIRDETDFKDIRARLTIFWKMNEIKTPKPTDPILGMKLKNFFGIQ